MISSTSVLYKAVKLAFKLRMDTTVIGGHDFLRGGGIFQCRVIKTHPSNKKSSFLVVVWYGCPMLLVFVFACVMYCELWE